MLILRFILVLIVFDAIALARKVKRKPAAYILHGPPQQHHAQQQQQHHHQQQQQQQHQQQQQQQHTAPSGSGHGSPPYHYEPVNHDEFPPVSHQDISRYEQDYHSTGTATSRFGNDNGLRSIAKGSADQANSAVASQNAAGKQAAYVAKSTLAQAAAQAAGTAIAVLKGKEVLLRRLEEQNVATIKEMEGELAQLQQAKRSAKAAQYAAQQAINHVSVLTAALNNAQAAAELAQRSASEAAAELSSQIDMVAQAKAKVEQIESQLYAARLDYEETKEAAEKATLSAKEAQHNANDAAVHANVELSESVSLQASVTNEEQHQHQGY